MRLVLILIVAAVLAAQSSWAQCLPGSSITVEVKGDVAGWTESGIVLTVGEVVYVSATGCICANYCHPDSLDMYDPDGRNCATGDRMSPDDTTLVCPYSFPLSLVARVGSGECFFVGGSSVFAAPDSGILSFCYNDRPANSGFIDNVGHFDVCIDRPVATQPCSWGTLKSRFH